MRASFRFHPQLTTVARHFGIEALQKVNGIEILREGRNYLSVELDEDLLGYKMDLNTGSYLISTKTFDRPDMELLYKWFDSYIIEPKPISFDTESKEVKIDAKSSPSYVVVDSADDICVNELKIGTNIYTLTHKVVEDTVPTNKSAEVKVGDKLKLVGTFENMDHHPFVTAIAVGARYLGHPDSILAIHSTGYLSAYTRDGKVMTPTHNEYLYDCDVAVPKVLEKIKKVAPINQIRTESKSGLASEKS